MTVPTAAVQVSQAGNFVFVVKDGKADRAAASRSRAIVGGVTVARSPAFEPATSS